MKHFYKRDPQDPRLYHLVVDTTALPDDITIELIVIATRDAAPPASNRRRAGV